MTLKDQLDFLTALGQNNSLAWMKEHKAWYLEAKSGFEALVGKLCHRLDRLEPGLAGLDPASLTFRLNRDTRFGRDKSPYRTAFRAHLSPAGKAPIPVGDYLLLGPEESFLGGGLFASMFQDATARIRSAIVERGEEFEAVLRAPAFSERFALDGEKLKNVPRGFDREHPQAEYLKYKSWFLEVPFDGYAFAADEEFLDYAEDIFQRMKPFHDFLNRALEGFQMPERPGK